jgi:uncharacterized protein YndB with AHSA1/START domain
MTETYTTTIDIKASPDAVYRHFVQPERLVRWMGDYARLEAVAGGVFSVDINGVLIRGRFVALEPGRRIEIAWGELGNAAMPPGATRLVIDLDPVANGTRLTLTHSGLAAEEAAKHAVGWPHFLARLIELAENRDPGIDPWGIIKSQA